MSTQQKDVYIKYARLEAGDPAPWFEQRSTSNEHYHFDTAAGRYIVLCFFGNVLHPSGKAAIDTILKHRELFDDQKFSFFGVSIDPMDEQKKRLEEMLPGIRYIWDFDGRINQMYGTLPLDMKDIMTSPLRPMWFILDPTLRIIKVIQFHSEHKDCEEVIDFIKKLPEVRRFAGIELQAPVLYLPNVFEPEFCRHLIGLYEQHGGKDSGFMSDVDGKTVLLKDYGRKRRSDYIIRDEALQKDINRRIWKRIVPEIQKVHFFEVTRIERFLVACYSAEDGGHFRAHRDNMTKGTAHRRFAVTINLNQEFEGGELSFPEYGPRSFKPPLGGAVVFSCALLHEVSKVTKGQRFAFLPFLYDEAARKIRDENAQYLDLKDE